jgi:hypothetical protein
MDIYSKTSFVIWGALALVPISLAACTKVESTGLEARVEQLESREEIRSVLLDFVAIVDSGDPTRLPELLPLLHPEISLRAIDFLGEEHRFDGTEELLRDYAPIMAAAQADLVISAIVVEVAGNRARAGFKGIGSVLPPPELIDVEIEHKLLLFADAAAVFERDGEDWKLRSLELRHSLAFPEQLPANDE